MKPVVFWGGWLGIAMLPGHAASVALKPAADATLFSFQPGNNDGKGTTIVVGGIFKSPSACRSLVRFDLGTNLPAGAVITNVSLKLNVTREKGSSGPIHTGFHRVQQAWEEGTKNNAAGGATAAAGEATWTSRKKGTANWTNPGATGDFVATASATIALDNTGAYTLASTSQLIADVQAWQADPATNFGWILVAQEEGVQGSARRLATRESPSEAMTLTIEFAAPTTPTLPTVGGRLTPDGFIELTFPAQSGVRYAVQRRTQLDATAWSEAATFAPNETGAVTHRAPLGTAAEFFRVIVQP